MAYMGMMVLRPLLSLLAAVGLLFATAHSVAMAGTMLPAVAAVAQAGLPDAAVMADMADCHGAAEARDMATADGAAGASGKADAPDCCGDGCKSQCSAVAALAEAGPPPAAWPVAAGLLPTLSAEAPAGHADGLSRPPRPFA